MWLLSEGKGKGNRRNLFIMAGIVFSTMAAAIDAAHELKNELDTDIHVVRRGYPSGEEYFLSQFERDGCVYIARVKPDHVFSPTKAGKRQAFEYAKKFDMFVKQNRKTDKGYTFTVSYTLTNDFDDV